MSERELEEAFEKLRANTKHGKWTQMGNRLTCNQCNPPHTSEPVPALNTTHILKGTGDDGLPILEKRW